jgi:hypothetical protein
LGLVAAVLVRAGSEDNTTSTSRMTVVDLQGVKEAAAKAKAKAKALGLLQPLEAALSLDADTLRAATAAAVAYCDAQGASSLADLVERASKLIANPQL